MTHTPEIDYVEYVYVRHAVMDKGYEDNYAELVTEAEERFERAMNNIRSESLKEFVAYKTYEGEDLSDDRYKSDWEKGYSEALRDALKFSKIIGNDS